MQNNKVSLVIFSCEGRERLLINTLTSFLAKANFTFDQVILAIDGPFDLRSINLKSDLIVQSPVRKGYVNSITTALKLITSEYFVWLEDDWEFFDDLKIQSYLKYLQENENFAQITHSKYGPLPPDFKNRFLMSDLYENHGFSANPCICRTSFLQEAFTDLTLQSSKDDFKLTGFETFLTAYFKNKKYKCIIIDREMKIMDHSGYLESTDRQYHMIHSLSEHTEQTYISGFGSDVEISIRSRLFMLPKLLISFVILSGRLLFDRQSYDYALRVCTGRPKKIKR